MCATTAQWRSHFPKKYLFLLLGNRVNKWNMNARCAHCVYACVCVSPYMHINLQVFLYLPVFRNAWTYTESSDFNSLAFFGCDNVLLLCFHLQNLWSCAFILTIVQGHKKHIGYFKNIKADSRNTTFYTTFLQIQQLELHFPQKKIWAASSGHKKFSGLERWLSR